MKKNLDEYENNLFKLKKRNTIKVDDFGSINNPKPFHQ